MTVLVTGATGNVGRHVVDHLLRRGERVRALTRRPEAAHLPGGVEVVPGDLQDPASLDAALEGVSGLHLMTTASVAGTAGVPGSEQPITKEAAAEVVAAAERNGVRHVTVLWSGEDGPVEQALEESRLGWTFLQPVEFMSNAREWVGSVRSEGVTRVYGQAPGALVHESDIGEVAAVALVESLAGDGRHLRRRYALTGPEALTPAERTRILGEALGRDLRFEELTEEQARDQVRASGAPEEVVDFVVGWYADPPASAYTVVGTVEEVTGHPARTFAQWAGENTAAFTP